MSTDDSYDDYIPCSTYDSRERVESRPVATNRPRSRGCASDNPVLSDTVRSEGTKTARSPGDTADGAIHDVVEVAATAVSGTTLLATDQGFTTNNNACDNTTDTHNSTHTDEIINTRIDAHYDKTFLARPPANNNTTVNGDNTTNMTLSLRGTSLHTVLRRHSFLGYISCH